MSFSNINFNLYKVFVAVYEFKNVSRAGKELFIGQPNVSRSIKELEKQLGVKLFHTSPRGVEPTSEGTELYHKVAPALAWIEQGEKDLKKFDHHSDVVVRILYTTSFSGHILGKHISEFNKKYPNVQFKITNENPSDAIDKLTRRRADIVLSTVSLAKNIPEFEVVELLKLGETYFTSIQFAKDNNLKEKITKEEFERLPLVLHQMHNFEKRPIAIGDTQEIIFQLVINGLGVGKCLKQFLESNHPNDAVFTFEVEGAELVETSLYCVFGKDYLSKATKSFIESFKTM